MFAPLHRNVHSINRDLPFPLVAVLSLLRKRPRQKGGGGFCVGGNKVSILLANFQCFMFFNARALPIHNSIFPKLMLVLCIRFDRCKDVRKRVINMM